MNYLTLILLLTSYLSFGQRSDFLEIDFSIADSIASTKKGASLNNLPVLTHDLTRHLTTDVEKFRAIYSWVSTNIDNDYSGYVRTRNKRKKLANDEEAFLEWNGAYAPKMFQKMLKTKKTACSGYAYLIRELTELANIECKIVNGYGRTPNNELSEVSTPNHSWNTVKLNNKWYLCDATWSAGRIVLEDDGPRFESNYHDGYFLADPALFIKNHYPLELEYALLSKPPTLQEFAAGPQIYKEAFDSNLLPLSPSTMHLEVVKHESVEFKMALSDIPYKNINLLLVRGNSNSEVQPEIIKGDDLVMIRYSFEKLGLFDVHMQVDDVIIATYVVRVKNK